jgi:hypothetical protein
MISYDMMREMSSEQNSMIEGYDTDLCHTRSEMLQGIVREMTMVANDKGSVMCRSRYRNSVQWPE